MSLPELIVASNRKKVAQIAQGMLDDRIGIIEGSRQMASLCGERIETDQFDPDFMIFIAVDSETQDLPIGEGRRHWAADALANKDLEIGRAESLYRDEALAACLHLVARFAHEKPPAGAYDYYTPET
jgi:hypothetical protein